MRYLALLLTILGLVACGIQTDDSQTIKLANRGVQEQININSGWDYLEQRVDYQELISVPDEMWQSLDLPHSWNAKTTIGDTLNYRRSWSWYSKSIKFPKYDGAVHLYFEGVNVNSSVFVNGQKAGGHVGGYLGFEVDITDYVEFGKLNEILVWVDNSENLDILPSGNSDLVIHGGITRDVWLKFYPEISLRTMHISTPEVSRSKAATKVQVQVNSKLQKTSTAKIVATLFDPEGNKRSSSSVKASIQPGISLIPIKLSNLQDPRLWSPDHPDLYKVEVSLESEDITDTLSAEFGYRWYRIDDTGRFYLNGEHLALRATHYHEKWTGLKLSGSDSLYLRDIALIKDRRANIVRFSHHSQDPALYRACDELGLLVIDEFPLCCSTMGSEYWETVTEQLIKTQVSQNYNHPSIILWSFGTEIPQQDMGDSLQVFMAHLQDVVHDYDPYRKTSLDRFSNGASISEIFLKTPSGD